MGLLMSIDFRTLHVSLHHSILQNSRKFWLYRPVLIHQRSQHDSRMLK